MLEEVPIKAYNITQLKDFYEVSYKVLHRWISDEIEVIGLLIGKTYTPIQVSRIFALFGTPKIQVKKNK